MTSLSVTYDSLRREVGHFLGFSRSPTAWNANQITDVDDVISAGLRMFYRPPRLPGERAAHQWSFLRPYMTIVTTAEVCDYDLPLDFGGLDGNFTYFATDTASGTIQHVSESVIRNLRQGSGCSGSPARAALLPRISDGMSDQTYILMLWPTPDGAYTIQARYFARQVSLSEDNPVPMGGPDHAEAIRAACMAAAEEHLDDELGPKQEAFLRALQASVDFDRRATSPENIGYNSGEDAVEASAFTRAATAVTTYEKYPLVEEEEEEVPEGEPDALAMEWEDDTLLEWETTALGYVEWEA